MTIHKNLRLIWSLTILTSAIPFLFSCGGGGGGGGTGVNGTISGTVLSRAL